MGSLSGNEAMLPAYCKPELRSSFPEKSAAHLGGFYQLEVLILGRGAL
jgi:hypothetical protein